MPRSLPTLLAVEAALLAASFAAAGPPATIPMAIAATATAIRGGRARGLAALAPALLWLLLSRLTGRRDLYFPYCMHLAGCLAACAPGTMPAAAGGGAVVAAFLAVRVAQGATRPVLLLEAVVAAAILALSVAGGTLRRARSGGARASAGIALLAALLALAALAL